MFENDPQNIADLRVLTVIFNAQNWKTRKKFGKKSFAIMINPGLKLSNMFSPTFAPSLTALA